jgi:hypothetical protein
MRKRERKSDTAIHANLKSSDCKGKPWSKEHKQQNSTERSETNETKKLSNERCIQRERRKRSEKQEEKTEER